MLMDVIPLDASLVKGSHGRRPARMEEWPVLISANSKALRGGDIESTDVFGFLREHVLS
jgi:hypothetical protein